jgi:tetratricopeptide (TPR) repeat protein
MTNVVELTLMALVGLSSNFHSGVQNLQDKNYNKAIPSLTAVIQAEPAVTDMKELSLLYRAEAYAASGKSAEALVDAAVLLKTSPDAARRSKAATLYTAQGGVLKDLRPKDAPKACLEKFLKSIQNDDTPTAKQFVSGPLRDLLDTIDSTFAAMEGRSILSQFARHPEQFRFVSEGFDDTNLTATLKVSLGGEVLATLGLVQQSNTWSASTLLAFEVPNAHDRVQSRNAAQATTLLSQLGRMLLMYASENDGSFPAKLDDLKQYGNPAMFVFTDPTTGKKEPYLYCTGLTQSEPATTIIAASPIPVNGTRSVLLLDCSVQSLSEEEFVKKALEQKWAIPSLIKKEDVAKDIAAEMAQLIPKLGDRDSKVRAAARARIKEIGVPAIPFLREEANNADPEISTTVKELLK